MLGLHLRVTVGTRGIGPCATEVGLLKVAVNGCTVYLGGAFTSVGYQPGQGLLIQVP